MKTIKKKKVFGLGELILQYAPGAYYLSNINTSCVICGQITNRVAKNNINIKSCCEACFEKPEIDNTGLQRNLHYGQINFEVDTL